jgi:deoxyguanosine kinase
MTTADPRRSRFVVIEGLIGVGKTSLCRLLERELGARLVLEPCEDNPFLASFYDDPDRFAFPAQMFYLATRYRQQEGLRQQHLFSPLVVSDYLFEKDRLFAEQTLAGHELDLYDRFASLLRDGIPTPDLVLFLDSPTEIILKRIQRRAIDAEQTIGADYLDQLRARYQALWRGYTSAPVIHLDTSRLNYVDDPQARRSVLGMIQGWIDEPPRPVSPALPGPAAAGTSEREEQPSLFGAGLPQEG